MASLRHPPELPGGIQNLFERRPCRSRIEQIRREVVCERVAEGLYTATPGLGMITVGRRQRRQNQVVRQKNRGFSGAVVSISAGRTRPQQCLLEKTQRCELFGQTIHSRWSGGQIPWPEGQAQELDLGSGAGRPGDRTIRTTGTPPHKDRVFCSRPVRIRRA